MQCEQIMSRQPYFLSPEQPVREAAEQMRLLNVTFLPVCNDAHEVVGALSDRDIVMRLVADARSAQTPVGELMSAQVFACHAGDDLLRAKELLEEAEVRRLVCLDADGRLVGMVDQGEVRGAEGLATSFSPAFHRPS